MSEAWFYKRRRHPGRPTKREARRAALEERIRCFFNRSGMTYGSPRITLDLWEEGWQVSQSTVAEIMAELGLQGRKPARRRKSLTRLGKRKAAPDLVRRGCDAVAPDVLWWRDMTEIETGESKFYLASVHDAFPRRALGYAMGSRHDTELVSAALKMAIATRNGNVDGVIFHTDRGSEYTSEAFQQLCGRWGVSQSMGRGVGSGQRRRRVVPLRAQGRVRPPTPLRHPGGGEAEDLDVDHPASTTPGAATAPPAGSHPSPSRTPSEKHVTTPVTRTRLHNQSLYEIGGLTPWCAATPALSAAGSCADG